MNEQTIKILTDLAAKLGTTCELLWSVLIKQAPIAAFTDLLIIAGLFGIAAASAAWARSAFRQFEIESKERSAPDPSEAVLASSLASVVTMVLVMVIGALLPEITAGFFNPQYWAFKQIIR